MWYSSDSKFIFVSVFLLWHANTLKFTVLFLSDLVTRSRTQTANRFGVSAEFYRHITSAFIRLTRDRNQDRIALQPRSPPNRTHSVAKEQRDPPKAAKTKHRRATMGKNRRALARTSRKIKVCTFKKKSFLLFDSFERNPIHWNRSEFTGIHRSSTE